MIGAEETWEEVPEVPGEFELVAPIVVQQIGEVGCDMVREATELGKAFVGLPISLLEAAMLQWLEARK